MSTINNAIEAKKIKTLNTLVRYDEGIMSRRDWLKLQVCRGAQVEESTKNRIQFNRTKFNRMGSNNDQDEYMKKCNEKVKCYNLRIPGESSFYEISKTEYDAFLNIQLSYDINTQKNELSEKMEAGTATDEEINEAMQDEFNYFAKYCTD